MFAALEPKSKIKRTLMNFASGTVDVGRSRWCAKNCSTMVDNKPVEAAAAYLVIVGASDAAGTRLMFERFEIIQAHDTSTAR
jgi:hypothetical protein